MEPLKSRILGIMSGTSLDGLDLCLAEFVQFKHEVSYKILDAKTFTYPTAILKKIQNCNRLSAEALLKFNNEYGKYIGTISAKFLHDKPKPNAIASHGHTVFHQPESQFTFQIGSGANIIAETGIDTICDFRTSDIALCGQGAPLVPVGDMLLFNEYDCCVNIGGFANINFNKNPPIAYDICPSNIILNELTRKIGLEYDNNGEIARKHNVHKDLLFQLNSLNYYKELPPKSLGREWAEKHIWPILDKVDISVEDKIATFTDHIAIHISNAFDSENKKALITGGGAFNSYLILRIKELTQTNIIIPDKEVVEFKEALIFAFLGHLYLHNQNNCLASVTGALKSNIGGAMYKAPIA